MNQDLKDHLKDQSTWVRVCYMLLYGLCAAIAECLLLAVVLFQLLLKLFTGAPNARLLTLGQGLGVYLYQIFQYLSFNSEYRPYPLGAWPEGEPKATDLTDQGEPD